MSGGSGSDVDPVREVKRLHLVIDDWYGDVRPDIKPIEGSLAPDFTWLGPDGRLANRDQSVSGWQNRKRSHRKADGSAGVDVEDVTVQRTIYGVHQLTYTKHLFAGDDTWTYTCSLWLRETERAPSGLQWLHLTETKVNPPDGSD